MNESFEKIQFGEKREELEKKGKLKELFFVKFAKKFERFLYPLILSLFFVGGGLKAKDSERIYSDYSKKVVKTVELFLQHKKEMEPKVININKGVPPELRETQKKILSEWIKEKGEIKIIDLKTLETEYPKSVFINLVKEYLKETENLRGIERSEAFKEIIDYFNELFSYFRFRGDEFSEEDRRELLFARWAIITEFLKQNAYHPGTSLERIVKDAQKNFEIYDRQMKDLISRMEMEKEGQPLILSPNLVKNEDGTYTLDLKDYEISMLIGGAKIEGLDPLDLFGVRIENVVSLRYFTPEKWKKNLISEGKNFIKKIEDELGLKYKNDPSGEAQKLKDQYIIINAICESAENFGRPVRIKLSNGKTIEVTFNFDILAGVASKGVLCGNYTEVKRSDGGFEVIDEKEKLTKRVSCGSGWEILLFGIPPFFLLKKRKKKEKEEKKEGESILTPPPETFLTKEPGKEVESKIPGTEKFKIDDDKTAQLLGLKKGEELTLEKLEEIISGAKKENEVWYLVLEERKELLDKKRALEEEIQRLKEQIEERKKELVGKLIKERERKQEIKKEVIIQTKEDMEKIKELENIKKELLENQKKLKEIEEKLNEYKKENLNQEELLRRIEERK